MGEEKVSKLLSSLKRLKKTITNQIAKVLTNLSPTRQLRRETLSSTRAKSPRTLALLIFPEPNPREETLDCDISLEITSRKIREPSDTTTRCQNQREVRTSPKYRSGVCRLPLPQPRGTIHSIATEEYPLMLIPHPLPHMELEQNDNEKTNFEDLRQPHPAQPVISAVGSTAPFTSKNNRRNASSHPKIAATPPPSSITEEPEATGYDSDCLVIVECDPADYHLSPGDGQEMSQSSTGSVIYNNTPGESERNVSTNIPTNNNNVGERSKQHPRDESLLSPQEYLRHHKLHNLPIHELKKKLAYCPVCEVQCTNHKVANLCLNKHGMRQCWLCLEVIPNSKDSYFQHCVSSHAVRPSSDMVACPYCHKFFDFRQGINQHIVKVHFSEDTSFFSTTACLSPASLVDIYTGQSRSNSNGSSSGGNVNDAIQEESQTVTTLQHKSEGNDSIVLEEIQIIRNTQEGVGGTVSQLSLLRRPPKRAGTRESVIRETSSWCEANPESRSSYTHNSDMERESHLNNSRRPQSNPHPVQNLKQQVNLSAACMGESNLTLPQRPSSDPLQPSSYTSLFNPNKIQPVEDHNMLGYFNTPHTPFSGGVLLPPFQSQLTQQKKESPNSYEFPPTSVFHREGPFLQDFQKMLEDPEEAKVTTEYLDSVKSMLKTVADYGPQDPVESGEPIDHHLSDPLSLMGNSGESSDASRTDSMTPDSRSLSEDTHFKVLSHAGVKRRILTKWDEHQEKKCEPGSPSQSLAYFGESIYPPHPSTLGNDTKYQHANYHHQPFSLEGSLRAPGGLHDMPPEDQQFWEQILRESSAMHKSAQNQEAYQRQYQELQYRVSLHQQTQNHIRPQQYYPNPYLQQQQLKSGGESPSSYLTHVLSRGGENISGRQFGYTNSTHSCLLQESNSPGTSIASSQLMVYNQGQTHKQYEYRIIPQSASAGNGGTTVVPIPNHQNEISNHPQDASGMNMNPAVPPSPSSNDSSSTSHKQQQQQQFCCPPNYPQQVQSELPAPRKRKSAFPNRVIQQPQISPGDSVLVQNPFEEEEVTYHNQIRPPINNNNHVPLSPNSNLITRKPKYTSSSLPCHRVNSSSTLMTHPASRQQSQFDAVQIQQQQLLQHQQNVQIQINHHHHHPTSSSRLPSGISTPKLPSPEFLYQQQQQLFRMKGHRLSSGDVPMMPPVTSGGQRNFHFDMRSNVTGIRPNPKAIGNRCETSNTWPFAIAPRYQERCRSLAFHMKEMEMQQKLREKCKRNLISSSGDGQSTTWQ